MRLTYSLSSALLLLAGSVQAASSWNFDEGSVAVVPAKGSEGAREKLNSQLPLSTPITIGDGETIKIGVRAKDNGKAKRPHQAFMVLKDKDSGLEAPFPLAMKESGKGSVQIAHKDIPMPLLVATKPLTASIIIASFGSAKGLITPVFDLEIKKDAASSPPKYEKPLRYGKKAEIHHVFRADPQSPPKVISLFFALAVAATVPALFIGWVALGANLGHLSKAMYAAPLSHASFFGSIVAMEFVFFMYYTRWNLFQTLPVAAIFGMVTLLSGSRALGEVQSRRLAGER